MVNLITITTILLTFSSVLQAEEWVADFNPKVTLNAHPKNNTQVTKIKEKLDFGGSFKTINGMDVIHLRVRNGYHKMGPLKIQVKHHELDGLFISNRQNFCIPVDSIDLKVSGRTCILEFSSEDSRYKVWVEIKSGKIQEKFIVTKEK